MVCDMMFFVFSGWGVMFLFEFEFVFVVEVLFVFFFVGFIGGDFEVGEEEFVLMFFFGLVMGGGGFVLRFVVMVVVLMMLLLGFCEDRMLFFGFFCYFLVVKVGVVVKIFFEFLFIVLIER